MICEKCGKEIPENETMCPFCSAEEIAEVTEETETAEETVMETMEEPDFDVEDLGVPVTMVVRGKRGKGRVITGIIALLLMVAVLIASFVNPVLVIGKWKMHQTMATGMGADFQIESTMTFTHTGKLTLTDTLLNWEEVGYPEDQSSFSNDFNYSVKNGELYLEAIPAEGEETSQPVAMKCSITPKMFSYWQGETVPREVYDYQRDGSCYPSMYLWLVSGILLIVGAVLLAIPGKKHVITTFDEELDDLDEAEESEDLDEFLEEIYEEIEAEDETSEIVEETPEVIE